MENNSQSRLRYLIRKNWFSVIIASVFLYTIFTYAINSVTDEIEEIIEKQAYDRIINTLDQYGPNTNTLLCLVTNCYSISKDTINVSNESDTVKDFKIVYYNKKINYKPLYINYNIDFNKDDVLTKKLIKQAIIQYDLKPLVSVDGLNFYSTTTVEIANIRNVVVSRIAGLFVILIITTVVIISIIRSYIKRYDEMTNKQVEKEVLQRQLTESVHHELSAPIEVIRSNIYAGARKIYPCLHVKNAVCVNQNDHIYNDCKECIYRDNVRDQKQKIIGWHYQNVITALDNITDILNVMSNNKHISHTNGSVSLKSVFESIISSRRILSLNLVKVKVKNIKGLEDICVDNSTFLSSGKVVNIINSLINNSQEAQANEINVTWEFNKFNHNYLDIYVTDNGTGVRNKKGTIIKDVRNFKIKYGYSTKVNTDSQFLERQKLRNLAVNLIIKCFKVFTNILGNDANDIKVRGAGLHLNKTLLELSGGKLELYANSENGCTFRISIPVKRKHEDKVEENVIKSNTKE